MRPAQINLNNLKTIKNNISKYAIERTVHIIAVTKGFDASSIMSAKNAKLNIIGENRIQEFQSKIKDIPNNINITKHMIGHLQRNKAKLAIKLFDTIQTVDSIKIATNLNNLCQSKNKTQSIFLQINIGKDPSKNGFNSDNLLSTIEPIAQYTHVRVDGLMTILPNIDDHYTIRHLYAKTRKLQQQIQLKVFPTCHYLSMGMSKDYIDALQEGATHIRLGTVLYGQR